MPAPPTPDDPHRRTERELVVLQLVAEGKRNADIGRAVHISPKTASVHVSNILRKLGVVTRAHAAGVGQKACLIR